MVKSLDIDLHGKSLEEGEKFVSATIERAVEEKIGKVVVITGRGNHPNLSGARGIFFKQLPTWFNSTLLKLKPYIKYVIKNIGSYEIILQDKDALNNKLVSGAEKKYRIYNSIGVQKKYLDETELMGIIKNPEIKQEERLILIKNILSYNPRLLEKTCSDGTTILMVAASCNQVETMEFLLLQEIELGLGIEPKLLKQERYDGSNALMVATIHSNIESINFLLQKAPGFLKRKCHDGTSIFSVATKANNPKEVLDILFKHLENHKREKGYTGLFREYKLLNEEITIKNTGRNKKGRIQSIESEKFKKYMKQHSWFFIDRMFQFINSLKKSREEIKTLARETWRLNEEEVDIFSIKQSFNGLLARNNIIRQLFLRFNNAHKERTKKHFKHALYHSVLNYPVVIKNTRIKAVKKLKIATVILKPNKISEPIVNAQAETQKKPIIMAWEKKEKAFKSKGKQIITVSKKQEEKKISSKQVVKRPKKARAASKSIEKKKQNSNLPEPMKGKNLPLIFSSLDMQLTTEPFKQTSPNRKPRKKNI